MEGTFQGALIDDMSELVGKAYRQCQEISLKKIYKSNVVMDIEIAGYNIIHTLIDKVVNAVFNPDKAYSRQLINRIPEQYETENEDPYRKIMAVLDYLSGMTDIYALDLYRKINGMSLPSL
jgi:dGTPase